MHEIHDPETPGIIKKIIAEAESTITGEKAGPQRKAWAAGELKKVLKLPVFLPAPLQRAVLALAVEVVFQLVGKALDAAKGDEQPEPAKRGRGKKPAAE